MMRGVERMGRCRSGLILLMLAGLKQKAGQSSIHTLNDGSRLAGGRWRRGIRRRLEAQREGDRLGLFKTSPDIADARLPRPL